MQALEGPKELADVMLPENGADYQRHFDHWMAGRRNGNRSRTESSIASVYKVGEDWGDNDNNDNNINNIDRGKIRNTIT